MVFRSPQISSLVLLDSQPLLAKSERFRSFPIYWHWKALAYLVSVCFFEIVLSDLYAFVNYKYSLPLPPPHSPLIESPTMVFTTISLSLCKSVNFSRVNNEMLVWLFVWRGLFIDWYPLQKCDSILGDEMMRCLWCFSYLETNVIDSTFSVTACIYPHVYDLMFEFILLWCSWRKVFLLCETLVSRVTNFNMEWVVHYVLHPQLNIHYICGIVHTSQICIFVHHEACQQKTMSYR